MTNLNTFSTISTPERKNRAVLCPHCEHLNSWESRECVLCGRELFMECQNCGTLNERVRSRCTSCRKAIMKKGGRLLSRELRLAREARRRHILGFTGAMLAVFVLLAVLKFFHAL
jgi:hypothetical protein